MLLTRQLELVMMRRMKMTSEDSFVIDSFIFILIDLKEFNFVSVMLLEFNFQLLLEQV